MESNTGAPIANLKASSSKRCRQIPSILLWLVTQSAVWQQSAVFYQNCFLTSVFTSNPAHLVFNTASGHWSVCLFCVAQVHTRVGLHYSLFLSRTFFFFFPWSQTRPFSHVMLSSHIPDAKSQPPVVHFHACANQNIPQDETQPHLTAAPHTFLCKRACFPWKEEKRGFESSMNHARTFCYCVSEQIEAMWK